jgi:hypothetical protein
MRQGSRLWGGVGIIAQVLFLIGWIVPLTWQGPRYNIIANTISDTQAADAPHAWFPIAVFAAAAIGTFCFAVFGLRPTLAEPGRGAGVGLWMLAIAGLVIGNSFPLIPCSLAQPGCSPNQQLLSPGGITDAVVATAALLVLAIAPWPLWRRMKTLPRWQHLAPVMTAARIVCPACFLLIVIANAANVAQGLTERLLVTALIIWLGILAWTVWRGSPGERVTA